MIGLVGAVIGAFFMCVWTAFGFMFVYDSDNAGLSFLIVLASGLVVLVVLYCVFSALMFGVVL